VGGINFYESELIVRRLYTSLREHPREHIYVNPRRESDSLILVIEGCVEIESGERSFTLSEGECIYLPEGLSTRATHLAKFNKTINFFFDTVEGGLGSEILPFPHNSAALMAARELAEALRHEGVLDTNYIRYCFHKIVFHLTSEKTVDKKYTKVHALMLELETRYSESHSLADYARSYLMSESSLRSLFREYTGKSVIQYRNAVRLRRAEELIRDGMRVGEAALTVGFSSAAFYCRLAGKYAKEQGKKSKNDF